MKRFGTGFVMRFRGPTFQVGWNLSCASEISWSIAIQIWRRE